MFWVGIVDDKLVRAFRILEGVEMNSEIYFSFLADHLVKWYHLIDPTARVELVFMQDNAPVTPPKNKGFLASQ